ncbi:DNA mismatch repair endonuclease MutL [Pseudoalteromonas sp. T1lg48]|uniref:DNA mismatch repair endonuclease MutL n=1 Tax=Pseudoalteromonas sp. T1lg48 TaxID=2077100 RepID=UPI000CF6925D|nr:DNA mismatch repair endonuclease MutL [Pseudoalteromonas sp. T1lg48]
MSIEILPARLANQIAAGEVVERPASVVKELVENSLDAGATRIRIDIERGGHKLIRITDNGSGIAKDELTLALSRHATSKLKSLDDLENICSLGFRGEALASISSVSRLTLKSKPAAQTEAWQAFAEGRDMAVQVQPTAHPDGTSIEVKDLFFNTPARRKFLRTEKTEFNHIDELLKRIALSRLDIALTLTHNGKVVRQYRPVSEEQAVKRIAQVAGKGFAEQGMHLQSGEQGLYLHGWIMPQETQTEPQYTYVNGRMMRDKLILHAIRQAFEEHVGATHVPAFVLYLEIDPRQVDVNVHPAKHEVRFHQARLVHDFILQAVQQLITTEQSLFAGQEAVAQPQAASSPAHSGDYPKSHLQPQLRQPQHEAQSWGSAASASPRVSSGGGVANSGYASSAPKAAQIEQANRFYQGISEVQAHGFTQAAQQVAPIAGAAVTGQHVEILPLHMGRCAFSQGGELYLGDWRSVLLPAWQQQLQEDAQLPARALLLPVRVAINNEESTRLAQCQSWLAVLGFDLELAKQHVMVKRLPSCLYSLDAKEVVERLLAAPLSEKDGEQPWLQWLLTQVPAAYFDGNDFLGWQLQLQKCPEIMQRLQQKAVKIDVSEYLNQISV